ncbi:MAG TPA: CPBP family intramembrane glutamic endopeptidase [Candidatus Angelobacter sp.]|nr:CPBP family intramembrane glutamic endopeptidase [Candidatus Angelobacter sp.]
MPPLDPIPSPDLTPPPEVVPQPIQRNENVDLLDVFLILLVAMGGFFFVGGIATVIYMVAHRSQHLNAAALGDALSRNPFFIVPTQLAVYLFVIGFMAFLVRIRHGVSLSKAIHWNLPYARRALFALLGGIGLALFSDIGEVVLNRWIPKSLPITEYFRDRPSALLLGAFGILVAPLMEEIMFRGFLYPALARWTGVFSSVVITALAFTMLHGAQLGYSWAPLLLILVVGLALTITRVVTESVATGVVMHMAYNFTLLLQTYIATHGFRQM